MKSVYLALALLALSDLGLAADADKRAAYRAAIKKQELILSTRPARKEAPAREVNINDEEVREVQVAARAVLPGALVNIGTVVAGCPCADGPKCQDQVWVVAYRPEATRGLMLSRIDGHWTIGPVQEWWLRHDRQPYCRFAKRGEASRAKYDACVKAQQDLYDSFPACEAEQAVPADSPASRARR